MRVFVLTLFAISAVARPEFASIFSDHAVLQRDIPLAVWGTGASEDAILRLGDSEVAVAREESGKWTAKLPPQSANSASQALELVVAGTVVNSLTDIVVGDVWLAAGQSNMQFTVAGMLKHLPAAQSWAETTDRPGIRFRRVNDPVAASPAQHANSADLQEAAWVQMSPETVRRFSAVSATFATAVEGELSIPVGLIDVSWGGKPIEPFIPRDAFTTHLLSQIRELADANKLKELAALPGGVIIRNPEGHPGAIYRARMAPLVPYGLRGFLWYQAESNAGNGEDPREYRHKMAAMISSWRQHWQRPDLPCHFVQLPSYPRGPGWIRVREEQRRALAIPHTGMVVTIDIPGDDIHPPNKIAVGERLARSVLRAASGPIYSGHLVVGSDVHVQFNHADSGLMVGEFRNSAELRTPQETANTPLRWFELAGEDGIWYPALARVADKTVVVRSVSVTVPAAVRYACHTKPQGGNLYNRDGLPASPFCSKLEWLPWP